MKRFGRYLGGLVLVLGLVLSACAAPEASAPAPQKPAAASPAPAAPQLTREQQLIEGAKKEGEVNLWLTTIEEQEKLVNLFQSIYPFLRLKIWSGTTSDILARITEEAKSGRHTVDVFIGTAVTADVYHQGLLAEYDFPNTAGWINQPAHKYFRVYYATAKLVVYNTDLVSATEVQSWDAVKSARWAGKTFASTGSDENPLLWAYLWREGGKLNWDKSFAFWGDVFRNTRPSIGGATLQLGRLAAGEGSIFYGPATTSTMRMMAKGAPVGIAPLGKMPGNKIGIGLLKSTPHPNAAKLLIDFLTSPEGLLTYANPTMTLVLDPKLESKARPNVFLRSLGVTYEFTPDELLTAENMKKSTGFWQKALGLRG